MIATGNVLPVVFGLSAFIGTKGPVIAENGGIVYYKERIYQLQSQRDAVEGVRAPEGVMPEAERLFTDHWRETEVVLKRLPTWTRIRAILDGWPLEIEATGFAIHLMEQGAQQAGRGGEGLRAARASALEEVVAIGDSDNDSKMLAGCGYRRRCRQRFPRRQGGGGLRRQGNAFGRRGGRPATSRAA